MLKANILLNQYGLFDKINNNNEIMIKYNRNKDIFYNMGLLLKKIYSY